MRETSRTIGIALMMLASPTTAHPPVIEWTGPGAARGCVSWSDACWHHYGVPVQHAPSFSRMLSMVEKTRGVAYVPGGWHPEEAWPSNWKCSLLSLHYLRYLGVCAGAFTFALGGARYHVDRWSPADYWPNGITAYYGMLGPDIWTYYHTYILSKKAGWILYWNGPLFGPEPRAIIVGPGHDVLGRLPTPAFVFYDGRLVWTWLLDLKVRIGDAEGYGCALGIAYEPVLLPSGLKLLEYGRVVLFGPHPEFATWTWWMLHRAYEFLVGAWTPEVMETIREEATLLMRYGMLPGAAS